MDRYSRDRRPAVRPVEKIRTDDSRPKLKITLIILLLLAGFFVLGYGIVRMRSAGTGWQQIRADSDADTTLGDEISLTYNIGQSEDLGPTEEKKKLQLLWTQELVGLDRDFDGQETYEGLVNVRSINDQPGKVLTVDDDLYGALEQMQESRYLFLGPLFSYYASVCASQDDSEAESYDPGRDRDMKQFAEEIADFASDPYSVSLDLLGNDQVRLNVSSTYLQYAEENEIGCFFDFGILKEAFITDLLAGRLKEEGMTSGYITSSSGCIESLSGGRDFSFPLYDKPDGEAAYQAAVWSDQDPVCAVWVHNFGSFSGDQQRYYAYEDGSRVTPYIGTDGMSAGKFSSLLLYSYDSSCAELMLKGIGLSQSDGLSGLSEAEDLIALSETGSLGNLSESGDLGGLSESENSGSPDGADAQFHAIWCHDHTIHADQTAELTDIYPGDKVEYN